MIFNIPLPIQDKLEIKPTVEIRERHEHRFNRAFSRAASDSKSNFLTRIRAGATAKYGKHWSFALQYQYAQDWIDKSGTKSTDEASDFSLGYAQYKGESGTLTFGRQKIALGTERLIGSAEWLNAARSVDGFRYQGPNLDVSMFKIGVGQGRPIDARVFVASHTWKWGQSSYVFKHDRVKDRDVDHSTVTHWLNKKLGDWTIDVEAAVQFGKNRGKDQRAWAWHSSASRPLGPKTKGFVEFNVASGGSNSNTVFTFDNLYPSNHKFYGSMDLQSWRNMNEVAAGVTHQIDPKTDLSAHWHSFTLRDPSDAWYGVGGAPNKGVNGDFVDPSGNSGRNVGWEFDLEATFRPTKNWTINGGVGLFQPGSFVRKLNSGAADRQTWFFLQGTYKF